MNIYRTHFVRFSFNYVYFCEAIKKFMGFKLEQLLPFLQGKKPKDFPRSKDSKFINKLILANRPDFGMFARLIEGQSP
ncbi:MAG: hypothetical protein EBQ67_06060 [Sphingobacteriia bacterium]|nr:hypothetical protein [Sphingobacteriia bacterium]